MGIKIFQRIIVSYVIIYGKALCKLYICVIAIFYNHYIHTIDNPDKIVANIYTALFRYQTLNEVLYIAPDRLCVAVNNNNVNLPIRSEYAATSKVELAHISANLLTVLIYLLAAPKVMEKLFELRTTQIYAVKRAVLLSRLESIISSKCAKELSC